MAQNGAARVGCWPEGPISVHTYMKLCQLCPNPMLLLLSSRLPDQTASTFDDDGMACWGPLSHSQKQWADNRQWTDAYLLRRTACTVPGGTVSLCSCTPCTLDRGGGARTSYTGSAKCVSFQHGKVPDWCWTRWPWSANRGTRPRTARYMSMLGGRYLGKFNP